MSSRTGRIGVYHYPTMRLRLPDADALAPYLAEIDANRWYTNFGPLAGRLAARLADRYGGSADGVCTMANATLALTATLQESAQKRPGALCLVPSWTFAASVHAVAASGLVPFFVDIDARSGQLTPALAQAAVAGRQVAAVVVVSAFGLRVDPGPWESFRDAHGVDVVIDAAAAFDTVEISSVPTVVSLHATKPVTCAEGAFVLVRDDALIERLRRRSNFGFDASRCAQTAGLNAKLSEYHAAVGHASLDSWSDRRKALMSIAAQYRECLAALPGASLQDGWGERWIGTTLNVRLAACEDAARLCARLCAIGIEARRWWGGGCHRQPAFAAIGRTPLPATEVVARSTLGLPFHADLSHADVLTIAQCLRDVLAADLGTHCAASDGGRR